MFTHLDERNVKRLYTEYCNIQSEAGETEIDGPLLLMRSNGSSTIRLKAGWDSNINEFVFNLYGESGTPSVELNSTGNAVFKGTLNTDEDVFVGNRIFVGWGASTERPLNASIERGVYYLYPGSTQYIVSMYTDDWSATTSDAVAPAFITESSGHYQLSVNGAIHIESKDDIQIYAGNSLSPTSVFLVKSYSRKMTLNFDIYDLNWGSTAYGTFLGRKGYMPAYVGGQALVNREVVTANDIEYDYVKDECGYFYTHNAKFVCTPTTSWTVINSTSLRLTSSTTIIASTRSVNFVCLTTSAYYMEAVGAITSVDLTAFLDGTAMTTNDMLTAIIYVSSTVAINSDRKVYMHLGQSPSAYNEYNFNTVNYTTGWNLIYRALSPNATIGAPNMAAVTWARLGWRNNINSTSAYVKFDYIGVHRKYPGVAAFSDFQRNVNSTHQVSQKLCLHMVTKHANKPVINMSEDYLDTKSITLAIETYNFEAEIGFITHQGNYTPSLRYGLTDGAGVNYGDYPTSDSGYVECFVSSGVLKIRGFKKQCNSTVAGTTISDYINCAAFAQFKDCTLRLKNVDGVYTATFFETTNPDTYREVSLYGVTPVISDTVEPEDNDVAVNSIGRVYLGKAVLSSPALVYSAKVKKSHNLIDSTGYYVD